MTLQSEVEALKKELKASKVEKTNLHTMVESLQVNLANTSGQKAHSETTVRNKDARIKQLEEELEHKERIIHNKHASGLNLQGMVEQTLQASTEKLSLLEKKLKKQKSKNLDQMKENKELTLKLAVTSDELRICRSQISDLQMIRKQGTDGLMSEYSENLSLRERM